MVARCPSPWKVKTSVYLSRDRHIADLVMDDRTADDEDRYRTAEIGSEDVRTARAVIDEYAELRLDLADAVNMVRADRYLTDCVLTLDRKDFRAALPLTQRLRAFRVLPDGE